MKVLDDEANLTIKFRINEDNHIKVSAELLDAEGKSLSSDFQKEVQPFQTDKEYFKQIKNAVAHVHLTLLQNWTGVTQKWGY